MGTAFDASKVVAFTKSPAVARNASRISVSPVVCTALPNFLTVALYWISPSETRHPFLLNWRTQADPDLQPDVRTWNRAGNNWGPSVIPTPLRDFDGGTFFYFADAEARNAFNWNNNELHIYKYEFLFLTCTGNPNKIRVGWTMYGTGPGGFNQAPPRISINDEVALTSFPIIFEFANLNEDSGTAFLPSRTMPGKLRMIINPAS